MFADKGLVPWANYFYFTMASVTLVLGGTVVVLASSVGVALASLPSEPAKMRFGRMLNPSATMFLMFNVSQVRDDAHS